jgi:hypothetical protein
MASNKLTVSDFDFDNIKANLKKFLQSQTEFQDYNFEGSGFAILLDILAYNTHYLGFNANMLANEMYLDSADIRQNIVSLAKMLGYTPNSVTAPVANLSITVNTNNELPATLTIPQGTAFTTSINATSYQYITAEDYTITPINGVYNFPSVDIYEGTLVTYRYVVDSTDPDQKFIVPNNMADVTNTLSVIVQNSITDTTQYVYNQLDVTISTVGADFTVESTSKIYLTQEIDNGNFQVIFGDGVLGKKLDDGNIVILQYIVTNADASNGASNFTLSSNIEGYSDISIVVNSVSQGGSPAESKESVRFNAPLFYAAQNRAVTTTDYESIVRKLYPNALSVSAWGGENDEQPIYGVVKIAITALSGSTLTNYTKQNIINKLKPYNVASVRPVIVDPQITSILITSNIKYNTRLTSNSKETIQSNIINNINNYNDTTLQNFSGIFRYSKVVSLIDGTDSSITGNITTIKIRKDFIPVLNSSQQYNIYFRNTLYNPVQGYNASQGGIVSSSGFKINGDTTNVYYLDDDGLGNIRRYYVLGSARIYSATNQGTINYTTGKLTLNSLNITEIENIRGKESTVIEITVIPNSNDIVPVRDQILKIDSENSSFTVEIDTYASGSSQAGIGYTTSPSR